MSRTGMTDHIRDGLSQCHRENAALWVIFKALSVMDGQTDGCCFKRLARALQLMLKGRTIHAGDGLTDFFQRRSGNLRNVLKFPLRAVGVSLEQAVGQLGFD